MTTETEPMVRVLSVKCAGCGYVADSSHPLFCWEDAPASYIREQSELLHHCDDFDGGCGKLEKMLFATEPVR